jgi:hypothetical protein
MVFWSYGLVVGHPQPAERVTLSWSKGGFVVLWSFGVMVLWLSAASVE